MTMAARTVGVVRVLDVNGPLTVGAGTQRLSDTGRSLRQHGERQILVHV